MNAATKDGRLEAVDWTAVAAALDGQGWAVLPALMSPEECEATAALYDDDAAFRSKVIMARHGFGQGEYRYFACPLPPLVQALRTAFYPRLARLANQ